MSAFRKPAASSFSINLLVPNPAEAIEFYQKAFGFEVVTEMVSWADGKIVMAPMTYFARLPRKSTVPFLLIDEEWSQVDAKSPASTGTNPPFEFCFLLSEVNTMATQAEAAGGELVQSPSDIGEGQNSAVIRDPFGYVWNLSTKITLFGVIKQLVFGRFW